MDVRTNAERLRMVREQLDEERAGVDAALWDAADLARYGPESRRALAFLLMGVSVFGNALALGLSRPLAVEDLYAVVGGIVLQVILSWLQLVHAHERHPLYFIALACSAIPSIIGYYPMVVLPLMSAVFHTTVNPLADLGATLATDSGVKLVGVTLLLTLLMAVALVAVDVLPEYTLLRHAPRDEEE